jgi:hypothetical protein
MLIPVGFSRGIESGLRIFAKVVREGGRSRGVMDNVKQDGKLDK